ncbi:MAG: oligopeptide/dipeptide ABC transporter ATP-binding protein [Chlamydiota bacterium]
MTDTPLVEAKNISKTFRVNRQLIKVITDLSLKIYPKETLGLVGESGCGKTTLGRILTRLHLPTSGDVLFDSKSLLRLPKQDIKVLSREMQYIFQDPFASLNPRMTAGEILAEPLKIHAANVSDKQRQNRVEELLTLVGLSPGHNRRFPHEFSGGQRQRICIARALALNPRFIVCDEPIAALDVSIQAQIVNLLKKLQREMGLTYLFISHDLSMVKYIADRVAVMYLGHLMELAPSRTLYSKALHPYTEALLSAIPLLEPHSAAKKTRVTLKGELPSLLNPPRGCVFCTRCPKAMPVCFEKRPLLSTVGPNHAVACHLHGDLIPK